MKRIYLAIFSTIYIYNVILVTGFEGSQCFKFTWTGAGVCDEHLNCTAFNEDNPHIPCISVWCNTTLDTTELWNLIDKNTSMKDNYLCNLDSDNVCVRYTYMYDNTIVNASYFCGKVTEDLTTAVKSNCYIQYTQGYAIEVCACKPENNSKPCDSTIKNTYSILIIFMTTAVSLFTYKIFNIP